MNTDDIAIRVKNINKIYRIGVKEKVHDSFGRTLFDFVRSPIKNYQKYRSLYNFDDINFDEKNYIDLRNDIIWALKNVSFEVKKGEVLGLIGGNGAGKSTLLKIIARITDPTGGQAELHGRISSLLEVGTGFHQELTGRENVYLNATILGMTKREVELKFDDIVEFSGVEKFIDTPVKRYSSGMKVRLAFAVAAFMEPEILLVDEVLAVGDAAFQEKCIGKMSDVSKQGRTVIFVSHNMAAIEHLCERVILLDSGEIKCDTEPILAISQYFERTSAFSKVQDLAKVPRKTGFVPVIQRVEFKNKNGDSVSTVQTGDTIIVHIHYHHSDGLKDPHFGLVFENLMGAKIFWVQTKMQKGPLPNLGENGTIECRIPRLPLLAGKYFVTVGCGARSQQLDLIERACQLQVTEADIFGTGRKPNPKISMIFVDAEWEIVKGIDNPLED